MSSIRLLRTFLAVATEGSFAAAAPRVALTQAAVGQQMRALEIELRRPLFERHGKSVQLTESARALLPGIHALVADWDRLVSSAPADAPMAGTVHLGAIVSAVRPLLETSLGLKARHTGLEMHVSAAKSADLVARVAAGSLDAAVVVRGGNPRDAALAWEVLYEEPMVLLAPATLTVAPARTLLNRHPFIRFDPAEHTGQLVARSLRRLRVDPQPLLVLNALEGIAELVRSGLGVALVPLLREAPWPADPRLRVVALPQAERRQVALVRRRDGAHGAVIAALAAALRTRVPAAAAGR